MPLTTDAPPRLSRDPARRKAHGVDLLDNLTGSPAWVQPWFKREGDGSVRITNVETTDDQPDGGMMVALAVQHLANDLAEREELRRIAVELYARIEAFNTAHRERDANGCEDADNDLRCTMDDPTLNPRNA